LAQLLKGFGLDMFDLRWRHRELLPDFVQTVATLDADPETAP
jgi:hypothetical protein